MLALAPLLVAQVVAEPVGLPAPERSQPRLVGAFALDDELFVLDETLWHVARSGALEPVRYIGAGAYDLAAAVDDVAISGRGVGWDGLVWRSDGTTEGTRFGSAPLDEEVRGVARAAEALVLRLGDAIYTWRDDAADPELLRARGDPFVADVLGSRADGIVWLNELHVGLVPNGLWATKGTSESTVKLVDDIQVVLLGSLGDRTWFGGASGIWTSDGTRAGTEARFDVPIDRTLGAIELDDALIAIREDARPIRIDTSTVVVLTDEQVTAPPVRVGDAVYFVAGRSLLSTSGRPNDVTVVGSVPEGAVLTAASSTPLLLVSGADQTEVLTIDGSTLGRIQTPTPTTVRLSDRLILIDGPEVFEVRGASAPTLLATIPPVDDRHEMRDLVAVADDALLVLFRNGDLHRVRGGSHQLIATDIARIGSAGPRTVVLHEASSAEELVVSELAPGSSTPQRIGAVRGIVQPIVSGPVAIVRGTDDVDLIVPESGPPFPSPLEGPVHPIRVGEEVLLVDEGARTLWATDGTADGTSLREALGVDAIDAGESRSTVVTDGDRLYVPDHRGDRLYVTTGRDGGGTTFELDGIRSLASTGDRAWGVANDAVYDLSATPSPRRIASVDGRGVFWPIAMGERIVFEELDDSVTEPGPVYLSALGARGTERLTQIWPATYGWGRSGTRSIGDRILFAAWRQQTGMELWESDGTVDGTRALIDVVPGPHDSRPSHFRRVGDDLYFTAITPGVGRELWRLSPQPKTDVPADPNPTNPPALPLAEDACGCRGTTGATGTSWFVLALLFGFLVGRSRTHM